MKSRFLPQLVKFCLISGISTFVLLLTNSCGIGKDNEPCTAGAGLSLPHNCPSLPGQNKSYTVTGLTGKQWKVDKFMAMIQDSLKQSVGYQVAVAIGNEVARQAADGQAMTFDECNALDMGGCLKMNIASQTKTITAAATLKLLDGLGLDPNVAKVTDYLPADWNPSSWAKSLTFTDFLTHHSAMLSANSDFDNTLSWEGLKSYVQQDGQDSIKGVFRYRNANYALMRVVIPALWKQMGDAPMELKNIAAINDEQSRKYYEQYIQQKLLIPAGISGATLNFTDKKKDVLFYKLGINTGSGVNFSYDWRNKAGGGGWYMSAIDLAQFMAAIQTNDAILSPTAREWMENPIAGNNFEIGYVNEATVTGGQAFGHGGDLGTADGKEMHGMLMKLPFNISVCAMINSDYPGGSRLFAKIVNCYEAAWE